jgi:hypothetical protein
MDLTKYDKTVKVEAKPYRIATHSNISMFLECPSKYFFRNIEKIVPLIKSKALSVGSIFHDAIDRYNKCVVNKVDENTLKTVLAFVGEQCPKYDGIVDSNDDVMIQGMVNGFVRYFAEHSKYKIIETEQVFDLPHSSTCHRCGKIDARLHDEHGQLFLGEWKSCSKLTDCITKIRCNNQGNHYLWAFENDKPKGVVFRIVRKSQLRQKQKESLGEFRQRIFDDYISRPVDNFYEEVYWLNQNMLKRWKHEFDLINCRIESTIKDNTWYRNCGACSRFGGLCGYHDICFSNSIPEYLDLKNTRYKHMEPGEELFAIDEEV